MARAVRVEEPIRLSALPMSIAAESRRRECTVWPPMFIAKQRPVGPAANSDILGSRSTRGADEVRLCRCRREPISITTGVLSSPVRLGDGRVWKERIAGIDLISTFCMEPPPPALSFRRRRIKCNFSYIVAVLLLSACAFRSTTTQGSWQATGALLH